ncbi:MAG TPA: hypothetical protein VFV62_01265, partial [Gaiellaceae bacterium]|nr:hypothetical protein [Gaiellaceae bacterium]
MTILDVDTPHGPARAHVHPVKAARGALVLGHGAGGGITAPDLVAATAAALDAGVTVALSSDAPVVEDDSPLRGIHAAMLRRDASGHEIAPSEAI